jgi:hypothetical protein
MVLDRREWGLRASNKRSRHYWKELVINEWSVVHCDMTLNDLKNNRRPVTRTSYHIQIWQEVLPRLEKIDFVGANDKVYCVDGRLLSLTAVSLFCEMFPNENTEFLLPRRLDQDCMESLFTSIQQNGGF